MTTTGDRRRRVPGVVLRTLVSRLFDNRTAERFLFPAIADLQHETAASAGLSAVRRRAALWRNYLAFWKSFVTCLLTRPSAGVRADIYRLGWSGGFFLCATTALLMYGPTRRILGEVGVWDGAVLVLLLLPAALAVTVPCSVLWVGLVGRRRRSAAGQLAPTASLARSVFLYAIVAATASFVILVWAVPAANQSFREREWRIIYPRNGMAPPTVNKGLQEMTYAELGRALAASAGTQQQRARLGYYRHLKAAIPAGALAFGLITIALGGSRRNGRWSILKAASMFGALAFAYYVVLFESRQLAYALVIPAWLGAWGPPLLFAGSAMLIASIRLRRLALQPTA